METKSYVTIFKEKVVMTLRGRVRGVYRKIWRERRCAKNDVNTVLSYEILKIKTLKINMNKLVRNAFRSQKLQL